MKKIIDLNLERKIKKRKQKKKYLKIFLIFSLLFVVIFFVWKISLNRIFLSEKNPNFPILFSGDEVLEFEKTGDGFFVLTNNRFNIYLKDGKKVKSFPSDGFRLNSSIFEDFVLLYEPVTKGYSVYKKNKIIFKAVLQNDIISGKIFKNGNFAFITKGEKYFCELLVFNKKNEQVFKWGCAEGLIIDFNIFDDCGGCVLTTLSSKEGVLKTFVYEINFQKTGKEKFKKDLERVTPLQIKKIGSLTVLVCNFKLFFLDDKGSVLKSIEYKKELNNFTFTDSGYFVGSFLIPNNLEFKGELISYDKLGNKIAEFKTNNEIKKIKSFGNKIIYLTDNEIVLTDVKFKKFKKIKNIWEIDEFIYQKPYFYFVSMNKLARVLLK